MNSITQDVNMLKVILIDDEKPALKLLESMLCSFCNIQIAGAFVDPYKGISAVSEIKPDIVFLDIDMPQILGLDVASIILDSNSKTNIVFVTAFSEYAVDAFELYALDYLLKPVSLNRLQITIDRIKKRNGKLNEERRNLKIKCLGQFQIVREGKDPIKFRSAKTKELAAYLIHHREEWIAKESLIEAICPQMEASKADHMLRNAIYYIRKAFETYGIHEDQILIKSGYSLKLGNVELDCVKFEHDCEMLYGSKDLNQYKKVVKQYTGRYYESNGWLWAEMERERFSKLYKQLVLQLSTMLMEKSEYGEAEEYLKKAYRDNPYDEMITDQLITLYQKTGERTKAIRHYRKYKNMLRNELGLMLEIDI